jgi:hypothetical protein
MAHKHANPDADRALDRAIDTLVQYVVTETPPTGSWRVTLAYEVIRLILLRFTQEDDEMKDILEESILARGTGRLLRCPLGLPLGGPSET